MYAFLTGFSLGFSLILAIGAQNTFILRQGLKGEHVFWVCFTCALSDAILIFFGVFGLHFITEWVSWLLPFLRYGGALFLFWYGFRSLLAAYKGAQSLKPNDEKRQTFGRTLLICLALTWLNPHVYLDTVLVIGSVGSQFGQETYLFAIGAILASFLFFFTLGYSARVLRPLFAKPLTWRFLDSAVGILMWVLALTLVLEF